MLVCYAVVFYKILLLFLYILLFQQLGNQTWGLAREQGFHGGIKELSHPWR